MDRRGFLQEGAWWAAVGYAGARWARLGDVDPRSDDPGLEGVSFRWSAGGLGSVPVRYDAVRALPAPEWTPQSAAPSPAVLTLDAGETDLFVTLTSAVSGTVRGIAVDPTAGARGRVRGQRDTADGTPATPVLPGDTGPIPAGTIPGPGGRPYTLKLRVPTAALAAQGVGAYDVAWRWEHTPPGGTARVLGVSRHRVYVVLSAPQAPWDTTGERAADEEVARALAPYGGVSPHLPWAVALEVATRWARGAKTRPEVAAAVTRAVYALGRTPHPDGTPTLRYDPDASSHYATHLRYDALRNYQHGDAFLCAAFLDRVGGGAGRGGDFNCVDCAAAVTTFANLLGCDLRRVLLTGVDGPPRLRPVTVIGSTETKAWPWAVHAFAVDGPDAGPARLVYDACAALAGADGPTVGLPLGTPETPAVTPTSYAGRLLAGPAHCEVDRRVLRVVPPRLDPADAG